jgi:transketolase
VREFGMAAIMNGMALHGGYIPYGGTFLTFSDYSRNAIRMAALMKQRVIHVFTHDSIGLGEDGPTHQSRGARAQLRMIPGWTSGARPMAWKPPWPGPAPSSAATAQRAVPVAPEPAGAWPEPQARRDPPRRLCAGRDANPQAARDRGHRLGARNRHAGASLLAAEGLPVRVVSMPSTNVFDRQPQAYQDRCCPLSPARGGGGSGAPRLLAQVRGPHGRVVGIASFGESAPAKDLYRCTRARTPSMRNWWRRAASPPGPACCG